MKSKRNKTFSKLGSRMPKLTKKNTKSCRLITRWRGNRRRTSLVRRASYEEAWLLLLILKIACPSNPINLICTALSRMGLLTLPYTMISLTTFLQSRGIKLTAEGKRMTSAQPSLAKSSKTFGQLEMLRWIGESNKNSRIAKRWTSSFFRKGIEKGKSLCSKPRSSRQSKWKIENSSRIPIRKNRWKSSNKNSKKLKTKN